MFIRPIHTTIEDVEIKLHKIRDSKDNPLAVECYVTDALIAARVLHDMVDTCADLIRNLEEVYSGSTDS